jgi:nucleotide-binding universal stress UspA family protein
MSEHAPRELSGTELLRQEEENMFKHILLPTDGSQLSEMAIQKGIQFAKAINARVTGFHVLPEFPEFTYRPEILEDTKEEFTGDPRARAAQYLKVIEEAANKAGVRCDTGYTKSAHPYEAIITAAEENGCDLIVMAFHGRRGVQALLIGSETHKVLAYTNIPVLVYR